jgi:hypothetical protein
VLSIVFIIAFLNVARIKTSTTKDIKICKTCDCKNVELKTRWFSYEFADSTNNDCGKNISNIGRDICAQCEYDIINYITTYGIDEPKQGYHKVTFGESTFTDFIITKYLCKTKVDVLHNFMTLHRLPWSLSIKDQV